LRRLVRANVAHSFIERQNNSPFIASPAEDDGVRGSIQPFVVNRVGVVAGLAKVLEDLDRKVFVELKAHSGGDEREQALLVGELGGVGQGGVDVLGSQGRIATQDLVPRGAFGEAVKDVGNQDARSPRTEVAAADIGG
jgi:hypothetical protein